MRRSGVGRDAAPAAVARTHGLGRSGVTVRAHYGALPLDGWTGAGKAGESLPDSGQGGRHRTLFSTSQYPEARSLEQKSRGGAPKGVARLAVALARRRRGACPLPTAPFGALPPLMLARGNFAHLGLFGAARTRTAV